ncbi:MAG: hypothetical protein PHU64_04120 [Candidatus Omnitrophica bacterium]|jgi:hypothetical protein|nr:hypothetical protein [Candidatus Omnitrophota bacterium]MDD5429268.1 hypothetical protein [Candidatus Omnitrophota bacterium]
MMMKETKAKTSLTLAETAVVISIFAIVIAATGSILFNTTRSGAKLVDKAKVLQDANWAIDFMINEARWGAGFEVSPVPFADYDAVTFQSDIDHNGITSIDPCVWYWRGFETTVVPITVYGDSAALYRGVDDTCDPDFEISLQTANANRQELFREVRDSSGVVRAGVVDNPVDSVTTDPFSIFEYDLTNQNFKVILTVEYPGQTNSQTQTLRASVTALNDIP